MNWKMTAKTILMQLHHKVETFEDINKHLVLAVQNYLIEDMRKKFSFDHIKEARLGDSMHIHSYQLEPANGDWHLQLASRFSTDKAGVALSLGQQATAKVELETIIELLEGKISDSTLFNFAHAVSDVTPTTSPS